MIEDIKPITDRPVTSEQTKIQEPQASPATSEAEEVSPEVPESKYDLDIDENNEPVSSSVNTDNGNELKPRGKRSMKDRLKAAWPPSRKGWVVIVLVILVIGGITGYALTRSTPKKLYVAKLRVPTVPVSKYVPSTLSGLPVDPNINKIPVTGVMIENSDFARPQSGLSSAGVVFEAIAEGGITRFLALYQDTAPTNVGPIRSARPYYEQWALGFDASLAHVGGSPEALADIKSWGVKDLDQFYNSAYYHRVSTRAAPHNVYTGIATLNQAEATKNFISTKFTGFPRKVEAPSKVPTARSINLAISGPDFAVHYDYAATSNSYNRSEASAPHIDANTNKPISPKVVIAMVIPYSLEADGYHSDYTVIGSGQAYIFQDGIVQIGQWTKSAAASQIAFKTSGGQTITLNPGQTWITAVSGSGNISYTP